MLNELQKVQTELKFDCDDYDYKKLIQKEFVVLSKDTPSRQVAQNKKQKISIFVTHHLFFSLINSKQNYWRNNGMAYVSTPIIVSFRKFEHSNSLLKVFNTSEYRAQVH